MLLDLDRTAHGIDDTGKLGQQVIAGGIHHPATMLLDQGGNEGTIGREGADGGFLIVAHEATVARDIRAEDRRELAFHANRCMRRHLHALLLVGLSCIDLDYSAGVAELSTVTISSCSQAEPGTRREPIVTSEEDSTMPERTHVVIPATQGAGFVVRRGDTIKVIDVEGHQIGDFICFNLHQPREKLSTGETVNFNSLAGSGSIHLTVGSKFYSNLQNPMFEIVEDLAKGVHDLQFAPCSSALYAATAGDPTHRNCRDNLTQAVTPYGLGYLDIPDPVNLFQNTRPKADGTINYQPAAAKAGEYIALKALMDCLVAISACPFDQEIDGKRVNHPTCTPLRVEFVTT